MWELGPRVWASVLSPRNHEALCFGSRERVDDLALPHIRALPSVLPGRFARAAGRAFKAGFDGVELHAAHAYTLASFLSPLNRRTDGYGGTPSARQRVPLAVLQAVMDDRPVKAVVGARILGEETVPGGGDTTWGADNAVALAKAGLDFLSVSVGGKFDDARQPAVGAAAYPYTGPSGAACIPTVRTAPPGPFGRQLPVARALRQAIRGQGLSTPVVGAGGLHTFALAEGALERGDLDVVAAARQSLADPMWWQKMRAGQGHSIHRCKATNYCEALDQKHATVTCQLWDKPRDASGRLQADIVRLGRRTLPPQGW